MKKTSNPKKIIDDKKRDLYTRLNSTLKEAEAEEVHAKADAKAVKKHLSRAKKLQGNTKNINRRVDQRILKIQEVLERTDEIHATIASDVEEMAHIARTIQNDFSSVELKVQHIEAILKYRTKNEYQAHQQSTAPQKCAAIQKSYTPYYMAAAATAVGFGCMAALMINGDDPNAYNDTLAKMNFYPN